MSEDVVITALEVMRSYHDELRSEGDPDLAIRDLRREARTFADTDEQARTVLGVAPQLRKEIEFLRVFSGLGYGVLRPELKGSTAMGSLMRRKLEPVLTSLADQINILLGRP